MTVLANGLNVPNVQVGHVDKVKGNDGTFATGETGWPAVDVDMVKGANVEPLAQRPGYSSQRQHLSPCQHLQQVILSHLSQQYLHSLSTCQHVQPVH